MAAPSSYPIERSLRQADAVALSLRAAIDRLAIPLARAAASAAGPDVFLRLHLPNDLDADFLGAIESSKQRLSALVDSVPCDRAWPDPDAPPSVVAAPAVVAAPSVAAARMFSIRSCRVPAWPGLLALLEDFVLTWDPAAHPGRRAGAPARPGDPIYARADWRCTAPGCTSRRNLEDHHVVYRSRRGGDELANQICLCRFHHQRGEHGDLASCRGRAPLGILWRLGRKDLAVWYRNERRVAPRAAHGPVRTAPGPRPAGPP